MSRQACSLTRAALTLMTVIKSLSVVVSTISVNGRVRTAKIAALRHVQKAFDRKMDYCKKNMATSLNADAKLYQQYYSDLECRKEKIKQMD